MKKREITQYIHTERLGHLQSIILLLLLALVITLTVMRFQRDNDIRSIQEVATTAMVTPASITVGNPTPLNQSKNSITPISLRQTNIDVSLARSQAHIIFNRIYANSCLNCHAFAAHIDASLASETQGQFHGLGGGIRDIEWRQLLINGSTALVTIAATVWSRYAHIDEHGKVEVVTPTGKSVATYTLTNFNGHWLITNMGENSGP